MAIRPRPKTVSLLARRLAQVHAPAPAPGAQAPPQGVVNPYDYSSDATYQRIHALGGRNVADAEAQALEARKQLAIDQGDVSLAPDEQTAAAARANSFSALAQLARRRQVEPRALTEADNSNNLFYSGAAQTHQSDLVRSLMEAETGIRSSGRARMSQIESGLMGARRDASDLEAQAQEEAAGRLRDRLGDTPVGSMPGHPLAGPAGATVHSHLVSGFLASRRRPRAQPPAVPRPPGTHPAY